MAREKRSLTRRQEIAALLRTGPSNVEDLAARIGAHPRTVLDDLEHVRRSLGAGEKWVAHGAECGRCGVGPAVIGGRLEHLWLYLVGPFTGAILAVFAWRAVHEPGGRDPTQEES